MPPVRGVILPRSTPEVPCIDEGQRALIAVASKGATVETAAERLKCPPRIITERRDALIETFEVPNMAAVVYQSFLQRILVVNAVRKESRQPNLRNRYILTVIAEGGSNRDIAERLDVTPQKARNYSRALFKQMGVTGRTHSVRRGFEKGYFIALSDRDLAQR